MKNAEARNQYSTVGQNVPRIDGVEKVTGEAIYTADIYLKGMLHGKILRSPHPHARILSIDTARARRLPGVRAIVTGSDTLGAKYGGMVRDKQCLATDRVRYVGDEIAAVAADDADIAQEALELVRVEYEILPAVFDPVEAVKPGAPQIHEHAPNNISYHGLFKWGRSVDDLIHKCDAVLEDSFETHSQIHSYLEPHCAVADWKQGEKLTVWATTQGPHTLKAELVRLLGIPSHKLRAIKPVLGGGFGGKRHVMEPSFAAALLSKHTGRPVKVEYSREEEFTASRHRHPMKIRLKVGARRDGKLVFFDAVNFVDNGAYNSSGMAITFYAGQALASIYRLDGVRYDARLVYTNSSFGGPFRGYGNLQMRFAIESMMDMVAEQIRMDPADFRLINAIQGYETLIDKKRVTSCGLSECIRKVVKASRWKEKREKAGKLHGVGIASYDYASGYRSHYPHDSSSAHLKINDDGSVILFSGASDIGQGSDTTLCQIAAEVLGIHMSNIKIYSADTDITPLDIGTYGSRITFIAGNAVKLAATDARNQLEKVVADRLEADVEDLVFQGDRVFVKGDPDKGFTFREAVKLALDTKGLILMGRGSYDPPSEFINLETGEGQVSPTYSYGAQVAEVEVDADTGQVKVLKVHAAADCGFAINPLSLNGQAEGSAVCGFGMALFEQPVFDEGRILNPSFLDYTIPTSMDAPEIDSTLVETIDPEGPFGAKGVCEGYQVPVVPAITNAIYHATGIRVKEVPVNPLEILRGLERRKSEPKGGLRTEEKDAFKKQQAGRGGRKREDVRQQTGSDI
jgi:4-hydroxybenzoyl-CoA reductase subunit alpha